MTRAIDPFEEYLRKKKVEMLEKQMREGGDTVQAEPTAEEAPAPNPDEDPETAERVQQEMDEFFQAGQSAGAKYFSEAGGGLSEDKVDEIRDAIEDVLEEDVPEPQTEDGDDTFVHFFKEVQDRFDENPNASSLPDPSEEVAVEISSSEPEPAPRPKAAPGQPLGPHMTPLPQVSDAPEADAAADAAPDDDSWDAVEAVVEAVGGTPPSAAPPEPPAPAAEPVSEPNPFHEPDEPGAEPVADQPFDLAAIFAQPAETDEQLRQRVDLLGRLVVKLVEKSRIPGNELVEILIKAGIEF